MCRGGRTAHNPMGRTPALAYKEERTDRQLAPGTGRRRVAPTGSSTGPRSSEDQAVPDETTSKPSTQNDRQGTAGRKEPLLLTPGPLTTSPATRAALGRDWGSRDPDFIALNRRVCERLVALAGVDPAGREYVAVPIQGSGTFAIEAALGTLVGPEDKLLVLVNGAYGRRMMTILSRIGRAGTALEWDEDQPVDPAAVGECLSADRTITRVAMVHCETTSGILNPLNEIARVAARHGKPLIVDAMSSFGALPIDASALDVGAVVASSNKCLEGVPGLAFAIIRRSMLDGCKGQAPSLALDLEDQWAGMEKNGQWRFTPPVQVLAAFDSALVQHAAEGGVEGRGRRYRANATALIRGMTALGFVPYLEERLQAPIIVTFRMPADPAFDFERFYEFLKSWGFVIYPGKLTRADSFRIGCIGQVREADMRDVVTAVAAALRALGVRSGQP